MALVDRLRNICVSPATEWAVIAQERTEPSELVTSFVVPLAALSAIGGFIGSTILGAILPFGGLVGGFVSGLVTACITFLMIVIACYVLAFIINALAPTFGARQDYNEAFKTAVYANSPGLAAGVLQIIPILGSLVAVVAGFYGLYLLYLGLPVTMRAPKDKAVIYLVAIIVASIVLWIGVAMIAGILGMAGLMMRG